ncbi:MAG TPA: RDD family protein [Dehalococcoidia bacterium]|nr:RDD family protein [Dehalococcoidia bacterium]
MEHPASIENATGLRIVAAIIDIVALGIVFVVLAVAFGTSETTNGGGSHRAYVGLTGWPLALYVLIVFAYYAGFELGWAATPGKLVTGLRVGSLRGGELSVGQVMTRTALRLVDGLPMLYLLGFVVVASSRLHQRIGDMAAGTIVVRAEQIDAMQTSFAAGDADETPTRP